MTPKERIVADLRHLGSRRTAMLSTMETIDYLERERVPGDFVESGVYRGGHMLLARVYAQAARLPTRHYWLYDTFDGMSEPEAVDIKYTGAKALSMWEIRDRENGWCRAALDDVRSEFAVRGLLDENVTFVKGMVETTMLDMANLPDQIALLRLDTDWYSSTRTGLEMLYPRLSSGGVLVMDDYGWWDGARKAADEYLGPVPLQVIDKAARLFVKP